MTGPEAITCPHREPVTVEVAWLTGTSARTFREWARDHVDAFR